MVVIQNDYLRLLLVFLIAVGLTLGIPALFSKSNRRKYFCLGWLGSAAAMCVLLMAVDFVNDRKNGMMAACLIFGLLCLMLYADTLIEKSKPFLATPKGQTTLGGICAGGVSGMLIYTCSGTFLSVSKLVANNELIPCIIVLFCYFLINCILLHFSL